MAKRHDEIIRSLEQRLKGSITNYSVIKSNIDYRWGECDLLAVKEYKDGRKILLLFEVKSGDFWKNEQKAEWQLMKDLRNFYSEKFDKVFTFYVHGVKDKRYRIKRKKFDYRNKR